MSKQRKAPHLGRLRPSDAIFYASAALTRQPTAQENGGTRLNGAPVAMNHLLLGKKPLINAKPRKGPHPGAIPTPKNRGSGSVASSDRSRTQSTSSSGTTSTSASVTSVDATHYTCPQVFAQTQPHQLHQSIFVFLVYKLY